MSILKHKLISRISTLSIIVLIGVGIYLNSLHGEFQFDDKPYIVENAAIHDIGDFSSIWNFYRTRVVGVYTFALNYHFHQTNVLGYHLVNVVIHIVNAILVLWFIRLILSSPKLKEHPLVVHKDIFSLMVALIFLTHPIQTQAVTYITQRLASLATLFYLGSICCYSQARLNQINNSKSTILFMLALIAAFLGVFTKEITFTLPFVIALVEIYFLSPDLLKIRKFRISSQKNYIFIFICLIVLIVPLLFAFDYQSILFQERVSGSHDGDMITSSNYFLTQPRVVVNYLSMLMAPIVQTFDYDFPVSKSLFEPSTFLSFVFIFLVMLFGLKIAKRKPLISFGIFWFFITLSVESSIIPIPHVIFEHRLYLPSVGFSIVFCSFLFQIFKKRTAVVFITSAVILIFSTLTIQRNKIWKDEITFWTDNVVKSPHKTRPYTNLAAAYIEKGAYENAYTILQKAVTMGLSSINLYSNLGEVYLALNQLDGAQESFEKSLDLDPNYAGALHGLGMVYLKGGNQPKAEELFLRAVIKKHNSFKSAYQLAKLWAKQGNNGSAIELYEQIIKFHPNIKSEIYIELSQLYLVTGQSVKAENLFKHALEKFPENENFKEGLNKIISDL